MRKCPKDSLLGASLCLAASILVLSLSIHSMIVGSFELWGDRRKPSSLLVTPETHPYFFWIWLICWLGVGIRIGFESLTTYLEYRIERKKPSDKFGR